MRGNLECLVSDSGLEAVRDPYATPAIGSEIQASPNEEPNIVFSPLINSETLIALTIDLAATCVITLIIGAMLKGLHQAIVALIGGLTVPLVIISFAFLTALRPNPHHNVDYPGQLVAILLIFAFASIIPSLISSAATLFAARHLAAKPV
jgi:hypothetical protein